MNHRSATSPARPSPGLANLPRRPLTPDEQLDALRRVQAQADQRVRLGMQLFKAAEARVSQQRDVLDQVKRELGNLRGTFKQEFQAEHEGLREQVQNDVTRTLHQYDQWIGSIDENFTKAMRTLQERMEQLERQVSGSQDQMESMMRRAEALLDQTRLMISGAAADAPPAGFPAPPKRLPPAKVRPQTTANRAEAPDPAKARANAPTTPLASPQPPSSETADDKPNPIYIQLLRRLRGSDDVADKAA